MSIELHQVVAGIFHMDFGVIGFRSSHGFTTQVENLINGCPLHYFG
jgi:hypothetical protein